MTNPILPGFHPDASAVQVGGDYYIATSTFEWWPGIDIYHSRDLVNWDWCAAPISRQEQVPSGLMGNYNFGSLWAPHLSWSDGLFWLVYTDVKSATAFKDTLNYVITSPSIQGPWSSPVFVTASGFDPDNPLQKSGHACFLEKDGEWYITHICARLLTQRGNCTLGRETALQKIEWVDGWPRLVGGTCHPELAVDPPKASAGIKQRQDFSERVEFSPERPLPPSFKTLRGPLEPERDYSLTARPGWLRLYGGQSLSSHHKQTLFARRWQSFHFTVSVTLDFAPQNFQQLAGLVLFYDTCNWIYALVTYSEEAQSRTLQILRCDNNEFSYGSDEVVLPDGPITLAAEVDQAGAQFYYRAGTSGWNTLGECQPADHLSDDYIEARRKRCAFTGAMVGICAQDMDAHRSYADFANFIYRKK